MQDDKAAAAQRQASMQAAQITGLTNLANDSAALAARLSSDCLQLQAAAAAMVQAAAMELAAQQAHIAAVDGILASARASAGDWTNAQRPGVQDGSDNVLRSGVAAAQLAHADGMAQQVQDGLRACAKQLGKLARQYALTGEEVCTFLAARAAALRVLQAHKECQVGACMHAKVHDRKADRMTSECTDLALRTITDRTTAWPFQANGSLRRLSVAFDAPDAHGVYHWEVK